MQPEQKAAVQRLLQVVQQPDLRDEVIRVIAALDGSAKDVGDRLKRFEFQPLKP
jgi:hypothetical protein